VLQEAIHGTLVSNDIPEGEATASELLQQILKERQERADKEKGKKAKQLTLSTIEEEPWELPESWCWARLGDIVDHRGGLWEGKRPPFIRVGVIRNANFTKKFSLSFDNIAYLNVEEKQFLPRRLEFGDIIIEKSGGGENQPVGRPVLFLKTDGDFSFSNFTQMIRIADKEIVLPSFLQQVLVAFYVSGATLKLQSNTTNLRNLDFNGYLDLFVPLPPLSVQHRIVEKIEEVFAAIDKLE
jgi:type I restriction enzyme S subunit